MTVAALVAVLLAAAPSGAAAPARMLVTADEWQLVSSRQRVRAGRVNVQLYNRGEDAHDLVARRVDRAGRARGHRFRVRETAPGRLSEARWRLPAGRYRLWCGLPGHRAAGMRGKLRVSR